MPLSGYPVVVVRAVEWGDMDAFGHVNNTVYFKYFEAGRMAWFDALDLMAAGTGGISPIVHTIGCRFRAPLTYPDTVEIGVRCTSVGADRFVVEHAVHSRRLDVTAAVGEAIVVSFDYATRAKAPVPATWRAAMERLEGRSLG